MLSLKDRAWSPYVTGACPGTVFAQIGAGYRDAWLTLVGGLAGAAAFIYAEPQLKPLLGGGPATLTFDKLAGLPFWLLALVFAAGWVLVLVALERWRPWREELGADADGDGHEEASREKLRALDSRMPA